MSSASGDSQNYLMRITSAIPSAPQIQSRKRRATESTAVSSHDINSIPSESAVHQPTLLSSSAIPFSTNPFSPLPNSFSPSFAFSPLPSSSKLNNHTYDPTFSIPAPTNFNAESGDPNPQQHSVASIEQQQQLTPTDTGSVHTDPDKDPFLSLLEQLAENEQSRGGPSELDFFLSASGG